MEYNSVNAGLFKKKIIRRVANFTVDNIVAEACISKKSVPKQQSSEFDRSKRPKMDQPKEKNKLPNSALIEKNQTT